MAKYHGWVTGRIEDLIGCRRTDLGVVELDKRAGIEEASGQGSTVPAPVGNNFSGHPSQHTIFVHGANLKRHAPS
jgi:hypothetical protein